MYHDEYFTGISVSPVQSMGGQYATRQLNLPDEPWPRISLIRILSAKSNTGLAQGMC